MSILRQERQLLQRKEATSAQQHMQGSSLIYQLSDFSSVFPRFGKKERNIYSLFFSLQWWSRSIPLIARSFSLFSIALLLSLAVAEDNNRAVPYSYVSPCTARASLFFAPLARVTGEVNKTSL